jgi:hypothetical protein
MEARPVNLRGASRLLVRGRSLAVDRVSVTLAVVFVLAAAFYLWTAGTSYPLTLGGSQSDPYNLLATAFLHLRLSVGAPPAGLLRLPEPYNPVENNVFQLSPKDIHDLALYHGKLFLTWGPAPVIVLLVPLHLLDLAPSTSLTAAVYAIAGLGFALATLRVVLRQLRDVPLWMCTLAALVLALCSGVPFLLRRPEVYEEAIAGGFCFAMAGIWLAVSAILARRASRWRLVLMSLCFGLATGSRPTLALSALVLVPVYLTLRGARPRRELALALALPLGVCLLLLASYNYARYGDPLEIGAKYQLAGIDSNTAPFDSLSYVAPGLWSYISSLPRPSVLFPFLRLVAQPNLYSLAEASGVAEPTGGLLPMAPVVIFLAALPWLVRRRPAWLGSLGVPLLTLAGAGVGILLFLTYQFFSTTERYEVDYTALFLLGALAAWLALSSRLARNLRLFVRAAGGLLAIWGCLAGVAISFTGYSNLLAVEHPRTWRALEDAGAPLSTAFAALLGRPVLAQVTGGTAPQERPPEYTGIDAPTTGITLDAGEQATLTIVSPGARTTTLNASVSAGAGTTLLVRDPHLPSAPYPVPPGASEMHIPVRLGGGVNRLALLVTRSGSALTVSNLSLGGA